jgi:dTDP-4-dehydrorhamnose 3,5-epimerase
MKFIPLSLPGAYLIEPELMTDERGAFARTFCRNTFLEYGLNPHLEQCSFSFNRKKGTLRGMHFQKAPHAEAKLVRCTQGKIYDVVIDLRPDSPTYRKWEAATLTAENRQMLYIPEGFAHGFQTLEDDTEVFYQISFTYVPTSASGMRWDDPSLNISWPTQVTVISSKDQQYPLMSTTPS